MSDICREIEDLLPEYVFGTLPVEQRVFIEEHLEGCENCITILEELREVEQGLLYLAQPVEPPAQAKARLMAAIAAGPEPTSWVDRLLRLPFRRIAAFAIVLLLIVTNVALLNQTLTLQDQVESFSRRQETNQTALALASNPNSQVAELEGDNVGGTIVYDPGVSVAVVFVWGLQSLPADQVYQSWLIAPDGVRTSAGLVEANPDSNFVTFTVESSRPLSDYVSFGMTVEPAGGSIAPTGARVLGVEL